MRLAICVLILAASGCAGDHAAPDDPRVVIQGKPADTGDEPTATGPVPGYAPPSTVPQNSGRPFYLPPASPRP